MRINTPRQRNHWRAYKRVKGQANYFLSKYIVFKDPPTSDIYPVWQGHTPTEEERMMVKLRWAIARMWRENEFPDMNWMRTLLFLDRCQTDNVKIEDAIWAYTEALIDNVSAVCNGNVLKSLYKKDRYPAWVEMERAIMQALKTHMLLLKNIKKDRKEYRKFSGRLKYGRDLVAMLHLPNYDGLAFDVMLDKIMRDGAKAMPVDVDWGRMVALARAILTYEDNNDKGD